jgi:hypothetical protein
LLNKQKPKQQQQQQQQQQINFSDKGFTFQVPFWRKTRVTRVTRAMRLSLLCRVGNATARAVGCFDRVALRPTLRANCSLPIAPPAARPSSVGLGGAARRTPQVSNLGRVCTGNGIVTEGSERTTGYMTAGINGKKHYVHRLVAQAFLPPPPSEKHTQVNHTDGDPANNRADNLAWVTPSENTQHSYDTNAERKSYAP